jgi:hypothetical protein
LAKSSSRELLQAELDHMASFFRRLNEMASKGVHGSVTTAEAKQGLVGLYFFLFNVCQHLTESEQTAELKRASCAARAGLSPMNARAAHDALYQTVLTVMNSRSETQNRGVTDVIMATDDG